MDFLFLCILILVVLFTTISLRRLFSEQSEKKLLSEIEKDILEEFSLNKTNLSGSENINFDGLVQWIEDEQLEEEIKKKR
tara:strand:+ start:323 stop:562 length:240 start_codon:yes stop_codon:yes gene_type:complete